MMNPRYAATNIQPANEIARAHLIRSSSFTQAVYQAQGSRLIPLMKLLWR